MYRNGKLSPIIKFALYIVGYFILFAVIGSIDEYESKVNGIVTLAILVGYFYILRALFNSKLFTEQKLDQPVQVGLPGQQAQPLAPAPEPVIDNGVSHGLILSITFLLFFLSLRLGGGWELLFIVPFTLVALLVVILVLRRVLKNSNAEASMSFLLMLVMSFSIIGIRLSMGHASDGDRPFFIAQYYFPTLPESYAFYSSSIQFSSFIIYFIASTVIIFAFLKTGTKRVNTKLLLTIGLMTAAMAAIVVFPLVKASRELNVQRNTISSLINDLPKSNSSLINEFSRINSIRPFEFEDGDAYAYVENKGVNSIYYVSDQGVLPLKTSSTVGSPINFTYEGKKYLSPVGKNETVYEVNKGDAQAVPNNEDRKNFLIANSAEVVTDKSKNYYSDFRHVDMVGWSDKGAEIMKWGTVAEVQGLADMSFFQLGLVKNKAGDVFAINLFDKTEGSPNYGYHSYVLNDYVAYEVPELRNRLLSISESFGEKYLSGNDTPRKFYSLSDGFVKEFDPAGYLSNQVRDSSMSVSGGAVYTKDNAVYLFNPAINDMQKLFDIALNETFKILAVSKDNNSFAFSLDGKTYTYVNGDLEDVTNKMDRFTGKISFKLMTNDSELYFLDQFANVYKLKDSVVYSVYKQNDQDFVVMPTTSLFELKNYVFVIKFSDDRYSPDFNSLVDSVVIDYK